MFLLSCVVLRCPERKLMAELRWVRYHTSWLDCEGSKLACGSTCVRDRHQNAIGAVARSAFVSSGKHNGHILKCLENESMHDWVPCNFAMEQKSSKLQSHANSSASVQYCSGLSFGCKIVLG